MGNGCDSTNRECKSVLERKLVDDEKCYLAMRDELAFKCTHTKAHTCMCPIHAALIPNATCTQAAVSATVRLFVRLFAVSPLSVHANMYSKRSTHTPMQSLFTLLQIIVIHMFGGMYPVAPSTNAHAHKRIVDCCWLLPLKIQHIIHMHTYVPNATTIYMVCAALN